MKLAIGSDTSNEIERHHYVPGLALYSISAADWRVAASDTGRMRGKNEWDRREGCE